MSDAVLVAAITSLAASVPATLAAVASFRTHKEVRTNHGKRQGEYVELIHAEVGALTRSLAAHIADTNAHN